MTRQKSVILVVGDSSLRADLERSAGAAGYTAVVPGSTMALIAAAGAGADAALIDIDDRDGLRSLEAIRESRPSLPIIALGSAPRFEALFEARQAGAREILRKPFNIATLEQVLASALLEAPDPAASGGFLTRSPVMQRLLADVERAAVSEATIRIRGESGTGKDLLARFIHRASLRRTGPFVVVSGAGLSETLAESELFGHELGAFTGAVEARPGQIRAASGGTLVLDDVSELALSMQPKLLRVLQEREVTALGASSPEAVDLRVIATTQRDLAEEVAAGRFREDLFFRLDVIEFEIPPLRERPEDIELLSAHLLTRFADQQGTPAPVLGDVALDALRDHPFRGNVRELENLMRRATILFSGREIDWEVLLAGRPPSAASTRAQGSLNLKDLERDAIIRALVARGGNRTQAARALGISVRTLRNKIRAYDLGADSCTDRATPAGWVSA